MPRSLTITDSTIDSPAKSAAGTAAACCGLRSAPGAIVTGTVKKLFVSDSKMTGCGGVAAASPSLMKTPAKNTPATVFAGIVNVPPASVASAPASIGDSVVTNPSSTSVFGEISDVFDR